MKKDKDSDDDTREVYEPAIIEGGRQSVSALGAASRMSAEPVAAIERGRASTSALGNSRISAYHPVQHSPTRVPRDPTFFGDFGDFE